MMLSFCAGAQVDSFAQSFYNRLIPEGRVMATTERKHLKDWPEEEKPRERLVLLGPQALSDAQLLAVILRTGRDGRTAIDLGCELLEKFGDLAGIAQAGIRELCDVPGIGTAKAAEIKAAIELGRRHQRPSLAGASFCASQDVADYYRPRLKDVKQEQFRCLLLDAKNRIIRDEHVSAGTLSASLVHPRETFKAAVRESASAVIFVHNHPSGDARPSQEDILLTKRLVQAGDLLGIRVLDHVIVGDGGHYSFRDSGLLGASP